jgi:hypothetical protein
MDQGQFDRWTRLLAGTSRRDAMRLLVAGLASGSLGVAATRGALAQVSSEACGKQGDRCKTSSDCCNDFRCKNDKCRAKNDDGDCGKEGDRCRSSSDCCSKFRCQNDKCRSKDSDNSCGKQGDRCKSNSDCCRKFRCKNDMCRRKD